MSWRSLFGLPPSGREFSNAVVTHLKERVPNLKVEPGGDPLTLVTSIGTFYLTLPYEEARRAPRVEVDGVVRRWVAALLDPAPSPPVGGDLPAEPISHLLPCVRGPNFLLALKVATARGEARWGSFPSLNVGGVYPISLGIDLGDSIRVVDDILLASIGMTVDQGMTAALENLRRLSTAPFHEVAPGVLRSPWQDDFDASRLLLEGVVGAAGLPERSIALAPTRNCLLLAAEADVNAVHTMADIATEEARSSGMVGCVPLARRRGSWVVWPDREAGPRPRRLENLAAAWMSLHYDAQEPLLADLWRTRGTQPHIASVNVGSFGDGPDQTLATLTRGVETLLPKTDLVALVDVMRPDGEQMLGIFVWEEVAHMLGRDLIAQGLTPERWLTQALYTDAAVATLRRTA